MGSARAPAITSHGRQSVAAGPGTGARHAPVPREQHKYFPHVMKNIHLYRSAVMHFLCFFKKKKKKSVVCMVSSQVFKKEKKNERSLFSFKH